MAGLERSGPAAAVDQFESSSSAALAASHVRDRPLRRYVELGRSCRCVHQDRLNRCNWISRDGLTGEVKRRRVHVAATTEHNVSIDVLRSRTTFEDHFSVARIETQQLDASGVVIATSGQ